MAIGGGDAAVSERRRWADHPEHLLLTVWLVIGVAAGIFFFLMKSRRNYEGLPELPASPAGLVVTPVAATRLA